MRSVIVICRSYVTVKSDLGAAAYNKEKKTHGKCVLCGNEVETVEQLIQVERQTGKHSVAPFLVHHPVPCVHLSRLRLTRPMVLWYLLFPARHPMDTAVQVELCPARFARIFVVHDLLHSFR